MSTSPRHARLARAQAAFPTRPVSIVMPFPPRGGTRRVGVQQLQRAQPDGHTLMLTSTGGMMGLAGIEGDFAVREHLTPITLVAAPACVVAMHPGIGAASHLAAELFTNMAGIEMLHVPYRGTGLPGYSAVGWFALFAPRGVPPAIIERIATDATRALNLPETRARLATLGAGPEPMRPVVFAAYVDADIAKWQRVVRERNITLE